VADIPDVLHDEIGGCCVYGWRECVFGGKETLDFAVDVLDRWLPQPPDGSEAGGSRG
jgi:hypothetical protein